MTGTETEIGDRAGQFQIESALRAVAVHRGQKQLAGAERDDLARERDGVDPCRFATAMGENFPMVADALGVDRHDDALAAELFRRVAHERPIGDGCRIDRNLVCAGQRQFPDIVGRPDAAADGQRHEAGLRRPLDHVENDAAILVRRRDVEETEFVGASGVIGDRAFHGIARIAQIDEVDALDDPSVLYVEARNKSLLKHGRSRGPA